MRAASTRARADNGRLSVAVTELKLALEDAVPLYGPEGRTVGFHLQNLAGYQLKVGQIRDARVSSAGPLTILTRHAEPGSMTAAAAANMNGRAEVAARSGEDGLPVLTQGRTTSRTSRPRENAVRSGWA